MEVPPETTAVVDETTGAEVIVTVDNVLYIDVVSAPSCVSVDITGQFVTVS